MLSLPDFINGAFELLGGLLQISNCFRLWKDKAVAGVNWQVTGFFAAWGLWNLFYYPSLHQIASFIGGLVIVTANIVWVYGAIRFSRKEVHA